MCFCDRIWWSNPIARFFKEDVVCVFLVSMVSQSTDLNGKRYHYGNRDSIIDDVKEAMLGISKPKKQLSCSEVFACSFAVSHALHYYCTHESMLDVYCVCDFHVLPPHYLRLDLWKFLSSERNWDTKKSDGTSVLKKSTSEIPIEIPIFNRRYYIFTRSIFCCHVSLLEGTQSVIPLSYTLYHLGKEFEGQPFLKRLNSGIAPASSFHKWYTP